MLEKAITRLGTRRTFIGLDRPFDLPADGRYEDGHQGRDDIEEAERRIHQGGDGQDGGLRHAAAGPGEEGRGDRGGILNGTAQELVFVAFPLVRIPENIGSEDDGKVLVAHQAVQHRARGNGGGHHAGTGARKRFQEFGKLPYHAAGLHARAKAHGADDEIHCIEHTQHAPGREQGVRGRIARIYGYGIVNGFDGPAQQHPGLGTFRNAGAHLVHQFRLENERCDGRREGGKGQHHEGRHPPPDHESGEDRHYEKPGRNVEMGGQRVCIKLNIRCVGSGVGKPQDCEDYQGYDHGRTGGENHVTDVLEEVHPVKGRSHDRGVRHGRNLIPEVRSGNDGAGNDSVAESFGPADAQQRHADGGDGGPGGPRHHRNHGAKYGGGEQEHLGTDDFNSVIDEGGHHSAHHPGTRNGTNQKQDYDGGGNVSHIGFDGILEVLPGRLVQPHAKPYADARGK